MSNLTHGPAWRALASHRDVIAGTHLRRLFAEDSQRFQRFSLRLADFVLDFSKQRISGETMRLLIGLAEARGLADGLQRMAAGEHINFTEDRAALHIALRADKRYQVDGVEVTPAVKATLAQVLALAEDIRAGRLRGARGMPIRRVVNLGIGGSDLGPRMAHRALAAGRASPVEVDYVANVDPAELAAVLGRAMPDETLFILSSKSFGTIETLTNAKTARAWLAATLGSEQPVGHHFFAVTNNLKAATEFGIAPERCFELPEWVGGRYSMWSAIGLPLACALGATGFNALLAGAREMDEHFLSAPFAQNLPVVMALLGIWNIDFLGAESLAVLPYSHGLAELPNYLQQLDMESNGKRIDRDGAVLDCHTAPIVWGGSGTVGQHAFHQLFYQGTRIVPVDFVVPVGGDDEASRTLVGNALAQSAALMWGKTEDEARAELVARGVTENEARRLAPYVACPGNQPSSTILFPALTPRNLGRLIALYEHKVFVQGWIWGVNSYDQYGVELGKQMARRIATAGGGARDASTAGLMSVIDEFRSAAGSKD